MDNINRWLEYAIDLAKENAMRGEGPFAAIVVRNDEVIGTGVNRVSSSHDPTAHAELLAIREACLRLNSTDLSDCQLYASGEPCPMCMGVIYWTKPGAVYYACSKTEANAAIGFEDPLRHFYSDLARVPEERTIAMYHTDAPNKLEPFRIWSQVSSVKDNNKS